MLKKKVKHSYVCPKCKKDKFKTVRKGKLYQCRSCKHTIEMY